MYVNDNDYCGFLINGIDGKGNYFKKGAFSGNRRYHFNKCSIDSVWNSKEYSGIYAPYAWGGLWIISRKSLIYIKSVFSFKGKEEVSKNHIYEDLMIGIILNRFGIKPKYIPKMIK